MTGLVVRRFSEPQDYTVTWQAMQQFTAARQPDTPDEIWLLEHHPVYTQGLAGKAENLLFTDDIPVVKSDRGGQVTWHGPGQLMIYTLLDVRRLRLGARALVSALENVLVAWLQTQGLSAQTQRDAPGVYLCASHGRLAKIAALGLRISKSGCYHGVALNIDCDLAPFAGIHPCGRAGQVVTRLNEWLSPLPSRAAIEDAIVLRLAKVLGCSQIESVSDRFP